MQVNGKDISNTAAVKGYLPINRTCTKGDVVTLALPMPAQRIYANPAVSMDVGRVALSRGPLVYCIEEIDNSGGPVQRLKLPRNAELTTSTRTELFDGTVTLSADAVAIAQTDWKDTLYRADAPTETPTTLTAVPYYLWNNRGQGSMLVWIPEA